MTATLLAILSALGPAAPNAAMKIVQAPGAQSWDMAAYWPWITVGIVGVALVYIFQR